jgi:signal transduction histidine kinase
VQEGLTNALKHAADARATVRVRYGPAAIELEVADDGGARNGGQLALADADNGGHGLIGMRERVALYGGTLDGGRQPDGGWLLHARLPLAP